MAGRGGRFARSIAGLVAAVAVLATDVVAQDTDGEREVSIGLREIASDLAVPVYLTEADDGTGRLFVVDQPGQIRIVEDGQLRDAPYLDLADSLVELDPNYDERGLLGLAFHPDYAQNGRLFVYSSRPLRDGAPDGWDHTSRLSEFRVSENDANRVDPASERVVLEVDQPFANHNAGHIAFGDDGYLYVPLGDGGNGGDIDPPGDDRGRPDEGHGQTTSTLLGSVLRLDVDDGDPYGIPPDNPFVGEEPRDEIWAYGFRNPYGLSVDLETGDLYAADAGQALYEELNLLERGGNFGWNIREGTACFDPANFVEPPAQCPDSGARGEALVPPVVEYRRGPEAGSVIVAGIRYRGADVPELSGQLLFGDYGSIRFRPTGILYVAEPTGEPPWEPRRVRVATPLDGRSDGNLHRWVLGVSQDLDGEAYVLTTKEGGPTGSTGQVFLVESTTGESEDAWWRGALLWVVVGVLVVLAVVGLTAHRSSTGRGSAGGHP